VLKIHVVGDTETVAARLRDLDTDKLTDVTWSTRVEPAGLVLALPGYASDDTDAVVDDVETLWRERISEFARNVADQRMVQAGPAELVESRPEWAVTARRLGGRVLAALAHLPDGGRFSVEHIGSTSVPGLAAKPIVDLQLGVPDLKRLPGIPETLAEFGFVDVAAHRPNSPGVLADKPRGRFAQSGTWDKRLFVSVDRSQAAILHVRQIGSPWWGYTVEFRDWLRANPAARDAYQRMKLDLAAAHANDVDYDKYTVGKTAFFDQVQPEFEAWNASRRHS
jgi:GrpB-like predicted nucleotidyltransferase (UPF0157 family)